MGPNRLWKITCIYAEYFFIQVNIYVGGGNSNAGHAYFRVFFISASLLSHFIVRLPYVVRYWTMRKSSLFSWNTAVLWCYLRPGRYSGKSIGSTRKMDNCTNIGAAAIYVYITPQEQSAKIVLGQCNMDICTLYV